jgi:hypothetical protein
MPGPPDPDRCNQVRRGPVVSRAEKHTAAWRAAVGVLHSYGVGAVTARS